MSMGMDGKEIKDIQIRGALYIGMIFMIGLTSAFLILALFH
ncbi:hypothetical protein LIHA111178_11035 [Litorimonas haliclonae]